MITLSLRRDRPRRSQRYAWWPFVTATVMTCGSLITVLLSLRDVTRASPAPDRSFGARSERIAFVVLRAANQVVPPPHDLRRPTARITDGTHPIGTAPKDTGAATPSIVEPTSAPNPRASTPPALSPDAVAGLVPPRPASDLWLRPPNARDPFADHSAPSALSAPSPLERDSVLHALGTLVPALAAARVPTRLERDSAAKEAMLKIRLSGRTLLVPPDNSGGLIRASIPVRLFGRGPSKAAQARDRRADDEGQARLRRLLARADSARRARQDSLERSASRSSPSP